MCCTGFTMSAGRRRRPLQTGTAHDLWHLTLQHWPCRTGQGHSLSNLIGCFGGRGYNFIVERRNPTCGTWDKKKDFEYDEARKAILEKYYLTWILIHICIRKLNLKSVPLSRSWDLLIMNQQEIWIHKSLTNVKTYFYKPSLLSSTSGFQCIEPQRLRSGNARLCRSTPPCFQPGRNLWDSERQKQHNHPIHTRTKSNTECPDWLFHLKVSNTFVTFSIYLSSLETKEPSGPLSLHEWNKQHHFSKLTWINPFLRFGGVPHVFGGVTERLKHWGSIILHTNSLQWDTCCLSSMSGVSET